MICLGRGYSVQLGNYDSWAKYIMNIIIFKQIRGLLHPDSGPFFYGETFHQLHYFICMCNGKLFLPPLHISYICNILISSSTSSVALILQH